MLLRQCLFVCCYSRNKFGRKEGRRWRDGPFQIAIRRNRTQETLILNLNPRRRIREVTHRQISQAALAHCGNTVDMTLLLVQDKGLGPQRVLRGDFETSGLTR